MNISLTPELEQFVKMEVGSGLYQSASEVIRAGLRRLKSDQETHFPKMPKTKEELEALLLEAVERFDRGEYIDGEESRRIIFSRIKSALRNA